MIQTKKIFLAIFTLVALAGCSGTTTDTANTIPVLTTTAITNVGANTATGGGNVTSDGGATVKTRGICWSTNQNPTISDSTTSSGTGTGSFSVSISGLAASTTYYVRAYATNSVGTNYGDQVTFTTSSPTTPVVSTTSATSVSSTTATAGGSVTSDGGSTVTARGVCWSTSSGPTADLTTKTTDGTGTGSFTSSITGLTVNTTYYLRAYATNAQGTSYGSEVTFTAVAASSGSLSASVTTTTYNGSYAPMHVLAIWITNSSGSFVKSLMVYAAARKNHLTNWYAATSTGNTTDATTGATLSSHSSHTCTWNGKDVNEATVTDGTYKLCVEYTESNSTGKLATFSFTKGSGTYSSTSSTTSGVTLASLTWTPN